jgi:hypothetical protein
VLKSVDALLEENTKLTKQIEALMREKAKTIKATLLSNVKADKWR